MQLEHLLEALVFASTKPVSVADLARILRKQPEEGALFSGWQDATETEIGAALQRLKEESRERGIQLQEVSGGYRFVTHPDAAWWVAELLEAPKPPRLSPAALETLAVIAYRQPISRAEIEAVRGVAVGGVLETLVERGVVHVAGRAEVPGRPLIYETTPYFLEHFGLRDVSELPNVEELRRVKLPEPPAPDAAEQTELIHDPAGPAEQD